MQYSIYEETTWLYPDTPLNQQTEACLELAAGSHGGFYVLGEAVCANRSFLASLSWDTPNGPETEVYELLPVAVDENTSPTLMTTTNYESCRFFVTRKAPFVVYDGLLPFTGTVHTDRIAFYVSVHAPCQQAPGSFRGSFSLTDQETGAPLFTAPVHCLVHNCLVLPPGQDGFSMLNFFDYEGPERQHGALPGSKRWFSLYRAYVRSQLEMRCTHILLPPGQAIWDENGSLTGFDFSLAEAAGQIAMEEGAPWLCGGHIAHWNEWTGQEYFPIWSPQTGVTTLEGYLQLRLYFSAWAEVIKENHWESCMTQALADEPQVHNAGTYRILAAVCRKFLPGVPIVDAVETVDLGGGIDIWVPKQDTYEKKRETFEQLKAAGETFWYYTCAFPAGNMMNRSMDLPLTVSRLVLWMGALYDLKGFLHWGFNYYIGDNIWKRACCPHKGALLPAGDAHIVYPGPKGPLPSVRYMQHRAGAEDVALLMQLRQKDRALTDAIISSVCTSFSSYTADGKALLEARSRLLSALSALS